MGVSILGVLLLSLGVYDGLTINRLILTIYDLRLEYWLRLDVDLILLVSHLRFNEDDLIVVTMMVMRCKLFESSVNL